MDKKFPTERVFEGQQDLPLELETVFDFFSTPHNLEAITPPWLNFKIESQSTPEIVEGTEFQYKLKIRGLPARWHSRIDMWEPPYRFVDLQLSGPYALWHHTHTFERIDGGTRIKDRVRFALPMGRLGDLVAGAWVQRDVRQIFDYRATRIEELLLADRHDTAHSIPA